MSIWPTLLRVLLCLVLALNGATSAVAATHMQLGHIGHSGSQATAADAVDAPIVAAAQASVEDMPCHQDQHEPARAASDGPAADDATTTGSTPSSSTTDCCGSDTCTCACMHAAQAALPITTVAASVIDHSQTAHWLPTAHAAPALPHLIRPPIG
ncbi:hypothetical protein EER27_02575 [Lysobacter psychrotolerans]|uniref:CopL family metal-binding regulatory protein n=2 Tax=Montanilutibacter psychrotolerans TaxID=1327343 RepID=A0A3M8T6H3_9GAMM|nr:hypothetical protein EER27_02575 [Lysobacter psychrotolerans]